MRSTLDRASRNVTVYPIEWVRKLPKDAGRTRFTYSTWAFPQEGYAELIAEYFEFCRDYYKRQRYRANLSAYRSSTAPRPGLAAQPELRRTDDHARSLFHRG